MGFYCSADDVRSFSCSFPSSGKPINPSGNDKKCTFDRAVPSGGFVYFAQGGSITAKCSQQGTRFLILMIFFSSDSYKDAMSTTLRCLRGLRLDSRVFGSHRVTSRKRRKKEIQVLH